VSNVFGRGKKKENLVLKYLSYYIQTVCVTGIYYFTNYYRVLDRKLVQISHIFLISFLKKLEIGLQRTAVMKDQYTYHNVYKRCLRDSRSNFELKSERHLCCISLQRLFISRNVLRHALKLAFTCFSDGVKTTWITAGIRDLRVVYTDLKHSYFAIGHSEFSYCFRAVLMKT
jgi:hypothetical protein